MTYMRRMLLICLAAAATTLYMLTFVTESEAGRGRRNASQGGGHHHAGGRGMWRGARQVYRGHGARSGHHSENRNAQWRGGHQSSYKSSHKGGQHGSKKGGQQHGSSKGKKDAYDYDRYIKKAKSKTKSHDYSHNDKGHGNDKKGHSHDRSYDTSDHDKWPRTSNRLSAKLQQQVKLNNQIRIKIDASQRGGGGGGSSGFDFSSIFAGMFQSHLQNPAPLYDRCAVGGCTLRYAGADVDVPPNTCSTCNAREYALVTAELVCRSNGGDWHGEEGDTPRCRFEDKDK